MLLLGQALLSSRLSWLSLNCRRLQECQLFKYVFELLLALHGVLIEAHKRLANHVLHAQQSAVVSFTESLRQLGEWIEIRRVRGHN